MSGSPQIAAAGVGRMGRGIAVAFALAGHPLALVDLKRRTAAEFQSLKSAAAREIRATFEMLAAIGLIRSDDIDAMIADVTIADCSEAGSILESASFVFEAVPETLDAKRFALDLIGRHAGDAIIASTTSTILSTDLERFVAKPERFLNAHWLNPAFLVPLVELSPGANTRQDTTDRLRRLLDSIGKVPVTCAASPGYIVPRIQALAMNEAARMVEEGVASVDDIDKATRYGFGFRFAVLGILEFIDWGGGDILFHAGEYMSRATGSDRFSPPGIIRQNMASGRTGLAAGKGFLDYDAIDVPAYRQERLAAFVALLRHFDAMPRIARRRE